MIESSLSAEEIIRVAMNIEKQGIDFYAEMAERSEQQETKDVFLQLMSDEKEHLETFQGLLKDIPEGSDLWDHSPDQEQDIDAYLRSLIQLQTFGDKATREIQNRDLSPEEALWFAIQAEKDAIVYYSGAAEHARSGAAKDVFERIAGEERIHLMILTGRLMEH